MRVKLIAFSMVLLALPWLGWRYLAQMQEFLLQGRQQTQLLSARALATVLVQRPELLAGSQSPAGTPVVYARPLPEPPVVDGYDGDWGRIEARWVEQVGDPPLFRWQAAGYREWLYLLVEVDDPQRVFRHPAVARLDAGDHLRLWLEDEQGRRRRVLVGAEGAGGVNAEVMAEGWRYPLHAAPPLPIGGYWTETAGGYRVELRLPRGAARWLALGIADVDDPLTRAVERLERAPGAGSERRRILSRSPALQRILDGFRDRQGWIALVNAERWVLAAAGDREVPPRLPLTLVGDALNGKGGVWREHGRYGLQDRIVAAQPVVADGRVPAAVVVEERVDDLLSLQWRSFLGITLESLGVLLLVVLGLLLFASRIAWRIRRLGNETARAIDADGRVRATRIRAERRAGDELGGLSRRICAMLGRLQRFTGFLEGMPRTLRHELNNPLNVIDTSLQNLADTRPEIADDPYLQAAGRGVRRIQRIVHSLTEAAGLEQSLRADPRQPFDLAELVAAYAAACGETDPRRRLVYRGSARGLVMTGSDVRIEQLLDKLVENARDFTPAGGTITLSLERSGADLLLRVCNDGPPLPKPIRGQLFDSMLSLRDAPDPEHPHPGIGLFVARAIAEAHGGGLTAANRKDGGGAEFMVRLAGAAAEAKT